VILGLTTTYTYDYNGLQHQGKRTTYVDSENIDTMEAAYGDDRPETYLYLRSGRMVLVQESVPMIAEMLGTTVAKPVESPDAEGRG
jgi:uncharacterized protein YlzI (FlbEa/FlbD family)